MTRLIVTGLIAQHSALGGVAWDYLNFVLGLHTLGFEVYYIEDSGEWPYNWNGGATGHAWVATDCSENVSQLARSFDAFGLNDRWAYRFPPTGKWFGLTDLKRNEVIKTADALLNISGSLDKPELYRAIPKLIYIDTDPAFTQIALSTDEVLRHRIGVHDCHFSVGENINTWNSMDRWKPTKHPIFLAGWKNDLDCRDAFTTVMNWTSYKPVVHQGRTFGQKDRELTRFLNLPNRVAPVPLEIAMPTLFHERWESSEQGVMCGERRGGFGSPHELLRYHNWSVVNSLELCGDFITYRNYLMSSKGEWSVAKQGYVTGSVGWFSGRSACYLSAGRPVVVQNTGINKVIPTGLGVLAFSDEVEAAEGIREVVSSYQKHAKAAIDIAKAYFDSKTVLMKILQQIQSKE